MYIDAPGLVLFDEMPLIALAPGRIEGVEGDATEIGTRVSSCWKSDYYLLSAWVVRSHLPPSNQCTAIC